MVSIEGVDYSGARPGGASLEAAGKHFAVRYLYPYGNLHGNKGLTATEVNDLHAHGIQIPVVFEGTAGGMKGGAVQGKRDAELAQALLTGLPLPHDLPIYFAKDYDGNLGAAEIAYLGAAAAVIGAHRVGLYAGIVPIQEAQAGHYAAWFWQTYAWSGGKVAAGIHLYQYANGQWNGTVDFVRALQAEYGQHSVAKPAPAPKPKPVPKYAKPGRSFYTLTTGKPNLTFWKRLVWAADAAHYTDFRTMGKVQWMIVQTWLHHKWGYLGKIDGAPGPLTYACLQKVAQRGGYSGPLDGDPQTLSYKALARYLNAL